MYVCLHTTCMAGTLRGQKRNLKFLELEGALWGLDSNPELSGREASTFNH